MRTPPTSRRRPTLERALLERLLRHPVGIVRAWGEILIQLNGSALIVTQGGSLERYDLHPHNHK